MRHIVYRGGEKTLLELSWESKENNFRGLLGHFGVAFGDDPFHDTCGHRINAKFRQILVEISNLLYQRVPKSRSIFVEKKINLNTNKFILGIGPFSAIFFIVSPVFNHENSNLALLPTQKVLGVSRHSGRCRIND